MQINNNPNLGFGTAFIRFNTACASKLPDRTQNRLLSIITHNIAAKPINFNYEPKTSHMWKRVFISPKTGNVGIHYTNTPEKENKFINLFTKLLGSKNVKTNLIANESHNQEILEIEKRSLINWVEYDQKPQR